MKQQILRILVICAASLALGAQAQSSSDPSGSSGGSTINPGSSGSSSDTSGSSGAGSSGGVSGWMSRHLSATGRMSQHDIKVSQLNGAEVKSSSGESLGTINEIIVNPGSGRMDFAVLSLSSSSQGGSTSPSGGSSGSSTSPSGGSSGSSTSPSGGSSSQDQGSSSSGAMSSSSSSSSSGKQVAVPWMLLRPSSTGAAGTTSPSGQQMSFTFVGDPSKLQSAPNFDQNTDVSQTSWRQSVYSYFGLTQPGAATGGAESPGGSSGGGSYSPSGGGSQQQQPGNP